jgi:CelD/BcsL family acetyltransferase involved in cellulose biosynthesis
VSHRAPPDITVSRVTDFAATEARWRDLETRAEPSFFQTWTWTGCLAAERFQDPILVEAREDDRPIALALFNRRGSSWYLGETGDSAMDRVYIEFNGVLCETGRGPALTAACVAAARRGRSPSRVGRASWVGPATRRLVLSGIDEQTMASIGGTGPVRLRQSHASPFTALERAPDDVRAPNRFLESRSANTRQQIRRSDRYYESIGPITTRRAETLSEARAFLRELSRLHQHTWTRRGRDGAFADPFFGRFHDALIERGLPRGEIDLLRVSAGDQVVGYLYNFRHRGRSLAYQSGFDYDGAGRSGKPGLTCHHQALRLAAAAGLWRYDFLAGDDRYKRSLATGAEFLYWVEIGVPLLPHTLRRRVLDFVRRRSGGAPPERGPD